MQNAIKSQSKSQSKKINKIQKLRKSPMYKTLDRLRRHDNLVDNSVTFHFPDESVKVQKINKHFIYDNGRLRTTTEILEDLNALTWDNGAESFSIEE